MQPRDAAVSLRLPHDSRPPGRAPRRVHDLRVPLFLARKSLPIDRPREPLQPRSRLSKGAVSCSLADGGGRGGTGRAVERLSTPAPLVAFTAVLNPVSGSSTAWAANPSWRRSRVLCACQAAGSTSTTESAQVTPPQPRLRNGPERPVDPPHFHELKRAEGCSRGTNEAVSGLWFGVAIEIGDEAL